MAQRLHVQRHQSVDTHQSTGAPMCVYMRICTNASMLQCSSQRTKGAPTRQRRARGALMRRCSNAPMPQCSNAPMLQCSNAPMFQCSNAPMPQ